ncbi:unnamed protein product [Gadus morhua 'NCC']
MEPVLNAIMRWPCARMRSCMVPPALGAHHGVKPPGPRRPGPRPGSGRQSEARERSLEVLGPGCGWDLGGGQLTGGKCPDTGEQRAVSQDSGQRVYFSLTLCAGRWGHSQVSPQTNVIIYRTLAAEELRVPGSDGIVLGETLC